MSFKINYSNKSNEDFDEVRAKCKKLGQKYIETGMALKMASESIQNSLDEYSAGLKKIIQEGKDACRRID